MKVLIIRPSALGDTLMLMPAIAQLEAWAEITLVGRSPGIDFLRPYVHLSIDYEGPGWHQLFLERIDDFHDLSILRPDRVAAFLGDHGGRVHNNLRTCLPTASVHIFPPFPPKEARVHVAFYLALCLQKAGVPVDPKKSLEEAVRRPLLEKTLPSGRNGRMVLHPGSGGAKKNHPPAFWIELIEEMRKGLLHERGGFILLLGPAEKKVHSFFRENLRNQEAEILLSPEKEKLSAILKQAPLYIGHDSGITHLAAMLGTPTIALFKNSSVHQWRPLGPAIRVIENEKSNPDLRKRICNEGRKLLPLRPYGNGTRFKASDNI